MTQILVLRATIFSIANYSLYVPVFFQLKISVCKGSLNNQLHKHYSFIYLLVFTWFLMTLRQLFVGVFYWQELFYQLWSQKLIYHKIVFQLCFGENSES